MATHFLASTPENVHWGYLDAKIPPALVIQSGDTVRIDCLCVAGGPPAPDSGFEVHPDLAAVFEHSVKGQGNHIYTGPVHVAGAAPGDVLEVSIDEIDLRQSWGYNIFRTYMGTLPEDYPNTTMTMIRLDQQTGKAILPSGLKVPMRPFFGQLVVAPPPPSGRQGSKEPREYGGNIDCKELVAGTQIFLPVWTDGALFSAGDGHAAQGDGEVNGTAIETSLSGTFTFRVHKGLGWTMPRAMTPKDLITFGFAPDLDTAAKQALRNMIDWIISETGVSSTEAYVLCSAACDLHVTQNVNGVKGIHAMLDKSILTSRQHG